MSSQTLKRPAQASRGSKTCRPQHCETSPPFPAALIPLPRIDAAPPTFNYAEADISAQKLAQTGLWMVHKLKPQDIPRPGPWAPGTEGNRIAADLIGWIEALLAHLGSRVLVKYDFALTLESIDQYNSDAATCIFLYFPRDVHVLSCDVLQAMAEENPGVEALVRAAIQSLHWFKYGYDYDDCFEEFQDWHEEQLNDTDLSEAERKEILQEIEQVKNEIPPAYRFLFRRQEKPEYPPFPECPPEASWLNPWWHWAMKTEQITNMWERPITESVQEDLYDREQMHHEYLTPFLWTVPGKLMDFYWEMLDMEAQSGGEACLAFPVNSASEAARSLAAIEMFSQWIGLFIEACILSEK